MLTSEELGGLSGMSPYELFYAEKRIGHIREIFDALGYYPEAQQEAKVIFDRSLHSRLREQVKRQMEDLAVQDLWPLMELLDELTRFSPMRLRRQGSAKKRLKTIEEIRARDGEAKG